MPRKPRVVAAGVPHHVTQRGNNRQDIFLVDEDRRGYLAALAANRERYGLRLLGYYLSRNQPWFLVPGDELLLVTG
jgi:putative transposase